MQIHYYSSGLACILATSASILVFFVGLLFKPFVYLCNLLIYFINLVFATSMNFIYLALYKIKYRREEFLEGQEEEEK